jgi:hypothetical protein
MLTHPFEFQTHSETNGIFEFRTLEDAMAHAEVDTTVWKISYSLAIASRVAMLIGVDMPVYVSRESTERKPSNDPL